MSNIINTKKFLLDKANELPMCSGVYIMKDKNDKIIYVGKSRKLKNRVTQYFRNSQKNYKTSKMVSAINDFEYIVCKTEIEALTLENLFIKQYSPKYNIKLKDAKSYPYIKITSGEYPKIVFTRKRAQDKAKYFGPFSGVSVVYSVLDIIHKTLGIPTCNRNFPKDIGKERPCIYYQMKQCCGLCTGKVSKEEYLEQIRCATEILRGNISSSKKELEQKMLEYAEEENFEAAIRCRDTITALERLNQKQNVVSSPDTDMDIFGLYTDDTCNCISSMYLREGAVSDKQDFVFSCDAETDSGALTSFLVEHYIQRSYIPKVIAISFELDECDRSDIIKFLEHKSGHKVEIRVPERGNFKQLLDTVVSNAEEKVRQEKIRSEKDNTVLLELANLLMLESFPQRIEAYDISNIGSENITAGMIVFVDGKPYKSDYRSFKIKTVVNGTDDYASMREALDRRFTHMKEDDTGSFSEYPDLILIDGGKNHVSVAKEIMREHGFDFSIYGMVKDDYHKTRALCTDKDEINIAKSRGIFNLIYNIQEEVHRFTVSKTMSAKRRTLKHSSLEKINGIGAVKAKKILSYFGTLSAVKNATAYELSNVSGISKRDAEQIFNYFHPEGVENDIKRT